MPELFTPARTTAGHPVVLEIATQKFCTSNSMDHAHMLAVGFNNGRFRALDYFWYTDDGGYDRSRRLTDWARFTPNLDALHDEMQRLGEAMAQQPITFNIPEVRPEPYRMTNYFNTNTFRSGLFAINSWEDEIIHMEEI